MKIKTHSGTKKRVKVKGSKENRKLTFNKAARRHLLVNKSKKQKNIYNKGVSSSDVKAVKKLLQI